MPDGTLVMMYVKCLDLEDGHLATYRRGCGVLLSHDHADASLIGYSVRPSHATLLDDGAVLTCYGCLRTKGVCLVNWRVPGRQYRGCLDWVAKSP